MLKGYKTMIINGLVVAFMAIKLVFPEAELPSPEDAGALVDQADEIITKTQALYVGALAFGNMVLRAVTSTSIFKKE